MRLLPTGNVTVTYWDQLRHTYSVSGNTHRCTEPCTYRDVYAPVSDEHAYSNWYVGLVNLRMLTHLHMSWAVVAQAVIRGDRLCHFPQGNCRGGATTWQRCLSFTVTLQWHNLCFCLFCFSCILVFNSNEVTFEPLQSWCAAVTHTCCFNFMCGSAACCVVYITWIKWK